MTDLLAALLLGILEGLTEFLPVSSTGHLLIAQHWLGERSDFFNIVIQAGAILATTLVFRRRIWELTTGCWRDAEARDYSMKLAAAFLVTALVGLAQVVAGVFPGTSRSAAAIFMAMLAGTSRRSSAAEFVFLVGIPTMFAASGYAFLELVKDNALGSENWGEVALAFAAATATGFVVVKWLLGFIKAHRFTGFAIYRIVLGALLLLLMPVGS